VLVDNLLAARRRAGTVLARNAAAGVLKVAVLPWLPVGDPRALYLAVTLPVAATVLVTLLALPRLVPGYRVTAGYRPVAGYRRDLAVERARVASGSSMAETACGPIEYAALGAGPAVLVVHGAGGGYDQMLDTARELADAGFRVVTMSRFGYLRTPLPSDASPQAQADAHACLLDALNIDRAAVLGVSAGGPSSMQFALRHPQRTSALVLLVPLAYPPLAAERLSPVAAFMVERVVQSDFLYWAAMTLYPDVVLGTILGTPPAVLARAAIDERARVHRLMRQILPLSPRSQGLLNEAKVAASLGRYDLERISAPTLVISLEDDLYGTYAGARYTAEHVPGARFVGYRSGGHMLVGHMDEVVAQVKAFLGKPGVVAMQP
jgi:pimeloyl-ACP methyl ester carboxylesterase